MLKCENDKCRTGETTPSACRKAVTSAGLSYRCPGCGGALTGTAEYPAIKPMRDIKVTRSNPAQNKSPKSRPESSSSTSASPPMPETHTLVEALGLED